MTWFEVALFGGAGLAMIAFAFYLWRRAGDVFLVGFTFVIGFLLVVSALVLGVRALII